jgi:hypothetical protein
VTECFAAVVDELKRRGYSDDDVAKIRGGNYLHALQRRDDEMKRRARLVRAQTSPRAGIAP